MNVFLSRTLEDIFQIFQLESIEENSLKEISPSPFALKSLKTEFISSYGSYLSITKINFENSYWLSYPSCDLSKLAKIYLRFKLWFFMIRLSSPTSFFAFSARGLNWLS